MVRTDPPPRTTLDWLSHVITVINTAASSIAHAALWLLGAVVLYDVTLRSIGTPPVWGAEVSVYFMLVLSFLGIGHTWIEKGHFRVTVVVGALGWRAQRAIQLVVVLVSLVFTVAFTYGAYKLAAFAFMLGFKTPTVLKMPLWVVQGLVCVGGAFLVLALIQDLIRTLQRSSALDGRGDTAMH